MDVIPFVAVESYRCAFTSRSDCAHHANCAPSSMIANGAAAALNAFYCCPLVLTISGGSFGETLSREQNAAGCEQHFSRREGGVGMHGVAIHAPQCQHRIGKQCIEAFRGIRDIEGRVATIARGNAVGARHFGTNKWSEVWTPNQSSCYAEFFFIIIKNKNKLKNF